MCLGGVDGGRRARRACAERASIVPSIAYVVNRLASLAHGDKASDIGDQVPGEEATRGTVAVTLAGVLNGLTDGALHAEQAVAAAGHVIEAAEERFGVLVGEDGSSHCC